MKGSDGSLDARAPHCARSRPLASAADEIAALEKVLPTKTSPSGAPLKGSATSPGRLAAAIDRAQPEPASEHERVFAE